MALTGNKVSGVDKADLRSPGSVSLPTNMTESDDLTKDGQDPATAHVYPRPLTEKTFP